jgi:hypothetical protein
VYIYIYIYLFILTAIGLTPVAEVQSTFTHKQYTEYREGNIHNKKKKMGIAGRAPLCELYPGICLTTEEKAWKNLT